MEQASAPRSFSNRSKIVPPSRIASRADGGKVRLARPAHPRVCSSAKKRGLAREVLRAALDEPGPAHVAGELARSPGRGQARIVCGDHDLRIEPFGGTAQGGERVLAGGAAVRVLVVEDVKLRRHRPAREVATAGRRRREPRSGQERVRRVEPAGGGMDDHRDPARGVVEAVFEAKSQVLEAVERAGRACLVVGLVARGEAQRFGLDPGHVPRLDRAAASVAWGCLRAHLELRRCRGA